MVIWSLFNIVWFILRVVFFVLFDLGEKLITRDCLSSMQGIRTDIPADHYEGCRPAAVDVRLGHYVNNSIKELDIHRNYYDKTTWCFCFLDHRCNDSSVSFPSIGLILFSILLTFYHFTS